jgi:hypothetical protein
VRSKKKYDTSQEVTGILQQLPGGKAMTLPGSDLIEKLQVE